MAASKYVCNFPTCVAFAVDGHDHCQVHFPEKVLERAKAIVNGNFERVTGLDQTHHDLLQKLRREILLDLNRTV